MATFLGFPGAGVGVLEFERLRVLGFSWVRLHRVLQGV